MHRNCVNKNTELNSVYKSVIIYLYNNPIYILTSIYYNSYTEHHFTKSTISKRSAFTMNKCHIINHKSYFTRSRRNFYVRVCRSNWCIQYLGHRKGSPRSTSCILIVQEMTLATVDHMTNIGSQSASSSIVIRRAPAGLRVATSGGRLQSTPVDDLGDVLRRVGPQSPIGQPLAQLGDAELTACRQHSRFGAVHVWMITVLLVPCSEDGHCISWQWTTSRTAQITPAVQ